MYKSMYQNIYTFLKGLGAKFVFKGRLNFWQLFWLLWKMSIFKIKLLQLLLANFWTKLGIFYSNSCHTVFNTYVRVYCLHRNVWNIFLSNEPKLAKVIATDWVYLRQCLFCSTKPLSCSQLFYFHLQIRSLAVAVW